MENVVLITIAFLVVISGPLISYLRTITQNDISLAKFRNSEWVSIAYISMSAPIIYVCYNINDVVFYTSLTFLFIVWLVWHVNTIYEITSGNVSLITYGGGTVGHSDDVIAMENIASVTVQQGAVGQRLGFGTISIEMIEPTGQVCKMWFIPKPFEKKQLIEQQMLKLQQHLTEDRTREM